LTQAINQMNPCLTYSILTFTFDMEPPVYDAHETGDGSLRIDRQRVASAVSDTGLILSCKFRMNSLLGALVNH